MAVSELFALDSLALRLVELERREADIERSLAPLLVRNGRIPDGDTERQIAGRVSSLRDRAVIASMTREQGTARDLAAFIF